jgi:hypothetical protein
MRVSFRCDEGLFAAIDRARGRVGREPFIRELIRDAVSAPPGPAMVEVKLTPHEWAALFSFVATLSDDILDASGVPPLDQMAIRRTQAKLDAAGRRYAEQRAALA